MIGLQLFNTLTSRTAYTNKRLDTSGDIKLVRSYILHKLLGWIIV
jgi:hypothetical protein